METPISRYIYIGLLVTFMYVYIYICITNHPVIYQSIYLSIHPSIYIELLSNIFIYIYIYVCMYVCIYFCIHMYNTYIPQLLTGLLAPSDLHLGDRRGSREPLAGAVAKSPGPGVVGHGN